MFPPKLSLELVSEEGQPTLIANVPTMFYHLRVVNLTRWQSAKECRVLLRGLLKRRTDGDFYEVSHRVPLQYIWAPSEAKIVLATVVRDQTVDFGLVQRDDNRFVPLCGPLPASFGGLVAAGEAIRFHVTVEALNFSSREYVIQVAYDGQFSIEPRVMAEHLKIKLLD